MVPSTSFVKGLMTRNGIGCLVAGIGSVFRPNGLSSRKSGSLDLGNSANDAKRPSD